MNYNSNYIENEWNHNYLKFIKQHLDKFNLTTLSKNPNITWDMIINNSDINWDWKNGISLNPNIIWDDIYSTYDSRWSWDNLISHPNTS